MATFQTYEQVGIKEDISDIITNISPTKTPVLSAMGTEKIHNRTHQWQEDSYRPTQGTGAAQLEGFTASSIVVNPTLLRNNNTQIFAEAVTVSGTTDAVSTYGRAKESAYQMAKSAAQLKRDLEAALVGTAQTAVVGADATARVMAGFQAQIQNDGSNTLSNYVISGGSSTGSNVLYTGAIGTLPSETQLTNVLQQLYFNGAEPKIILVTPQNSLTVAAFASATGRYRTLATGGVDKQLTNVVNVYVSPFGEHKVVIDRFLKAADTLIYDPEMWRLLTLRPWFRETLAKTGDNLPMMIVGEFSLKNKNRGTAGAIVQAVAGAGVY